MLENHNRVDSLEELNVEVIMMARIQPTDDKADAEPTSDADALGESNKEMSDLHEKKMPNESKLLKLFVELDKSISDLQTKTDKALLKDRREIKDCVLLYVKKHNNEILMLQKEKVSNDSKDIQATIEKRIKILENDFKRAEAQYVNLDLKMKHQNKKWLVMFLGSQG
nr:hypothetical protein [Tanacetum cinerariifolium]